MMMMGSDMWGGKLCKREPAGTGRQHTQYEGCMKLKRRSGGGWKGGGQGVGGRNEGRNGWYVITCGKDCGGCIQLKGSTTCGGDG
jgi:hypothetical protein